MGIVVGAAGGAGCVATTGPGSRGQSLADHKGNVSLVFTNASPAKMCALRMTFEDDKDFGDNWLPAEGLASGKSITFKVQPGKYKATWNTCKPAGSEQPYYAGTLTQELAFEVGDATQLFAYVADTVAPTSRAAPVDFHKLVKFAGQTVGGRAIEDQIAAAPAPAVPNELAVKDGKKPARSSMSEFVDRKPARKGTAVSKRAPIKASLKRSHDVATESVGYGTR
ncbi:MAG TPA: hypothetical protein VFQ53_18920 [Kofleriaceae bacterium]|nr:hypothetical protein [Kofleriaceae bacterium]